MTNRVKPERNVENLPHIHTKFAKCVSVWGGGVRRAFYQILAKPYLPNLREAEDTKGGKQIMRETTSTQAVELNQIAFSL